jgi:Plasmid pRiA4b ORF-3-like protein
MPKSATKTPTLVHIKVTLNDIRPAIWRRLRVPDSMDLGELSMLIQAAMGWDGGHMHAFEIGGLQYGDPEWLEDGENEDQMTIQKLMRDGISRFCYTYDFGDNWDHTVLIEKKAPPPGSPRAPACVGGARACPPEDCGGPPGYDGLITALAAPDKPSNRELLEWAGEDFDPEYFSQEAVNARLKSWSAQF